MHTDRTSLLIVEQTVPDGMSGLAQPVAQMFQTRSAPAGAVV